jgi:hypothetical protein
MQAASTAAKVKDPATKMGVRTAARAVISFFLRFTSGRSRRIDGELNRFMTQNAQSCISNLGTWTAPQPITVGLATNV